MQIYTFYVRLFLFKELPPFSIGQLNVIVIIVHIHTLLFLYQSQRHMLQEPKMYIF